MKDLHTRLLNAEEGSRDLSDEVLLALGWKKETYIHPGLSADYGEDIEAQTPPRTCTMPSHWCLMMLS